MTPEAQAPAKMEYPKCFPLSTGQHIPSVVLHTFQAIAGNDLNTEGKSVPPYPLYRFHAYRQRFQLNDGVAEAVFKDLGVRYSLRYRRF